MNRVRLALFVSAAISATLITGAYAQQKGQPSPQDMIKATTDHHLKQLDETVKLTEDQKKKIRPIILDVTKKLAAVMENKTSSDKDRGAQQHKLIEDGIAKVKKLLTPDQIKKLEAAQAEAHKKAAAANAKAKAKR